MTLLLSHPTYLLIICLYLSVPISIIIHKNKKWHPNSPICRNAIYEFELYLIFSSCKSGKPVVNFTSFAPETPILQAFFNFGKYCRGTQIIFLSLFCFSLFCPRIPCFARVSGFRVVYSEITDCGKSEQE